MPLQNRVTPDGRIIADPARGTLTGNRGILHRAERTLGPALWAHRAWVCCELAFKDHHRVPMTGRSWTELFFLDEAVALAAGHRPCAYCRRADFVGFQAAWGRATRDTPTAPQMDATLHAARAMPGARKMRHHLGTAESLPNGAFVVIGKTPHLLTDAGALPYAPAGYGPAAPRPSGHVTVLTPKPILAVLRNGYAPRLALPWPP